jgi:hypothetical protein
VRRDAALLLLGACLAGEALGGCASSSASEKSDGSAAQSVATSDGSAAQSVATSDGSAAQSVETCSGVDASACVLASPSYATDIAPLLDRDCNRTCHAPGAGPWPLTDYQSVHDWADVIAVDVASCFMPPADAGTMPNADRVMLLNWVACGALNN